MVEQKEKLRKELRQKLLALASSEVERRSKNVQENICKLSIYQNAETIMVYHPLQGEVDLLGIVRKVLDQKNICFPVIDLENKTLVPYRVRDLENDFIKGPYGIMQPDRQKAEAIDPKAIDVLVAPGLAFDRNGNRLGRGAGYYDRFVKQLNGRTKRIGVAFDFQILEYLPTYIPQDEKVDIVITETTQI